MTALVFISTSSLTAYAAYLSYFYFCRLQRERLPSRSVAVWKQSGAAWGQWAHFMHTLTVAAFVAQNYAADHTESAVLSSLSMQRDIIKRDNGLHCRLFERWHVSAPILTSSYFFLFSIFIKTHQAVLTLRCPICVQRFINGVSGQCDYSSGVSAMGGGRTGAQSEGWQGSGSAVSSDRCVTEATVHLLIACIFTEEIVLSDVKVIFNF